MSLQQVRLVIFAWLAVVICSLLGSSAAAQLLFNTGLEHTIDAASSNIEVRDGPGPGLDPTTVNVLDGAVIAEQGDLSISLFENSLLQMSGGETAGGVTIADNGLARVSGGTIAGEVLVEGNARFELSADGALQSDVAVDDTAHFEMTGGTIEGEIALEGDATGSFSGGTLADTLAVADNAMVDVISVLCEDNVEAADDAVVRLMGGEFDASVEAVDEATLHITGGSFPAIFSDGEEMLADGGTILVLGGVFGEAGASDGGSVTATLSGTVNFLGGEIDGVADGSAPLAEFSAVLNGQINLSNSQFGDLALRAGNNGTVNVDDIVADNVTIATIAGGTVNVGGGEADSVEVFAELGGLTNIRGGLFLDGDLEAQSGSVIQIFGSSFFVNGAPASYGNIPEIAGLLTGTLLDGSPFSMTFRRQFFPVGDAGQIRLVPEPGTVAFALFAMAGLGAGLARGRPQH